MEKSRYVRAIEGKEIRRVNPVKYFLPTRIENTFGVPEGVVAIEVPHIKRSSSLFFYVSCFLSSLRALQWNAGGLRARSTELQHFLSSHPVDLICIQESNFNSSSSFRIFGFSTLRSDRTHSRCGISSPHATHASSDVIIFVTRAYSSLNILPSLFLRLALALIM